MSTDRPLEITTTEQGQSSWSSYCDALEALLRASCKAGFLVGAFLGLPFLIRFYDLEMLIVMPLLGLFGTFIGPLLSIPAILFGAAVLTCLDKGDLAQRHRLMIAGTLVGVPYGILVEHFSGFPMYPFILGGAIAGFSFKSYYSRLYYTRRHWVLLSIIILIVVSIFTFYQLYGMTLER